MNKLILLIAGDSTNYKNKKEMADCAGVGLLSLALVLLHAAFMIYFLLAGIRLMAYVNAASVLIYLTSTITNSKTKSVFSSIMIVVEISFYCIISTYLIGWNAQTQMFLIAVIFPCFVLFPTSRGIAWAHFAGLSCALVVCYIVSLITEPIYSFDLTIIVWLNIFACISSALIVIGVINISGKFADIYYNEKIEELFNESNIDSLTKIWNRRYAKTKLEELIAEGTAVKNFCIAIADVDFFKKVNDTYGHNAGDLVLSFMGEKISKFFRSSDIGARWGGEEFLIIMPDTILENAIKSLEKFRISIENEVLSVEGNEIKITITIGVAQYNQSMRMDELIEASDKALYFGKNNGRNRVSS